MKGDIICGTQFCNGSSLPVVIGAVILAGFNFASELTGADFSGIANVMCGCNGYLCGVQRLE